MSTMDRRRRKRKQSAYEFKPDPKGTNYLKQLYMTRLQRLTILKWVTFSMTGILFLVIQDVIMSQVRFSGATTDLPVAFILLVGLYEGLEKGSVFTLAASLFYWFSGSAPTPICVGVLCVLVVMIGLMSGLTILPRASVFALTGGITCITMLPMYPLVRAISKIGGVSWKE